MKDNIIEVWPRMFQYLSASSPPPVRIRRAVARARYLPGDLLLVCDLSDPFESCAPGYRTAGPRVGGQVALFRDVPCRLACNYPTLGHYPMINETQESLENSAGGRPPLNGSDLKHCT